MDIIFDSHVNPNKKIREIVMQLAANVNIMECSLGMPLVVFQDGVSGAYYVKCSIQATDAAPLCDLEAKLDYKSAESFKANRDLSTRNKTYQKMERDADNGREFNDIIVEYNTEYNPQYLSQLMARNRLENRMNRAQTSDLLENIGQ